MKISNLLFQKSNFLLKLLSAILLFLFIFSSFSRERGIQEEDFQNSVLSIWTNKDESDYQNTPSKKSKYYSPEELKKVLASKDLDKIYKALNDIKSMTFKGKITPLIIDIWNQDLEKHPTIPTDIAMEPLVRINLVDYLIQRYKNGEIEINTSELHDYTLSLLATPDPIVVMHAIIVLRFFEKTSDVNKLVELSKNDFYFRPVVISLGSMCNSHAKEGLEMILKSKDGDEEIDFIKNKIENRLSSCKFGIR